MKELRALFPAWLACTFAVAAGALVSEPRVLGLGTLAFVFGSVGLGAQSIGHEYTHRTLGSFLSQPADRRTLLLVKLGVLATLLVALGVVAWAVLVHRGPLLRPWFRLPPSVVLLATLSSLSVAPWLTMICRSPLAGAVFTIVIPATLVIAGDLIGGAWYGLAAGADVDRFKFGLARWGTLVLCAIGAFGAWRTFLRLEALDGTGSEVRLPRWLTHASGTAADSAPARRRHPVGVLIGKELRLQHMTFVIAGLYLASWLAVMLVQRYAVDPPAIPVAAATLLYFALLSIVIGSLASAEERQFGTIEWQVLLPMAAWKQWAVKVGVAFGLALALGLALPLVLALLYPAGEPDLTLRGWRELALVVTCVTICALYVSSLSTGGVRALVFSLPVVLVAMGVLRVMVAVVTSIALGLSPPPQFDLRLPPEEARVVRWFVDTVPLAAVALVLVLLLRFAMVNHRSADRGAMRVWRQVGLIGAGVAGTVIVSAGALAVWLAS